MTIDEHIGVIEDLKSTMSVCMPEPEKTEICTSLGEAIDTMRKYQKQEQVLDKIRSEIEQDAFKDVNGSKYIFVNRVNQILDKYKGEVRKRNEF